MRMNRQRVILETDEGMASDKHILRQVWEYRLKNIAPHYRVTSCAVFLSQGKVRE